MPKYSKHFLRHIGNVLGRMTLHLSKYPEEVSSYYMIPMNLKSIQGRQAK